MKITLMVFLGPGIVSVFVLESKPDTFVVDSCNQSFVRNAIA